MTAGTAAASAEAISAEADSTGAVSGEADSEGAAVAVAAAECRVARSAPNSQLLRTRLPRRAGPFLAANPNIALARTWEATRTMKDTTSRPRAISTQAGGGMCPATILTSVCLLATPSLAMAESYRCEVRDQGTVRTTALSDGPTWTKPRSTAVRLSSQTLRPGAVRMETGTAGPSGSERGEIVQRGSDAHSWIMLWRYDGGGVRGAANDRYPNMAAASDLRVG